MTDLRNDRQPTTTVATLTIRGRGDAVFLNRADCVHGANRRQQGDGHPGRITLREGDTSSQPGRPLIGFLTPELARRTNSLMSG
jgi:hypothetical protein